MTFAQALERAAADMAWAPSSHNCQPWRLRASGHHVSLEFDESRRLHALPRHAVEMQLSLGAAWWTLCRSLAAQGWASAADDVADGVLSAEFVPAEAQPSPLTPHRSTNRGPYDSGAVDTTACVAVAAAFGGATTLTEVPGTQISPLLERYGAREYTHRDAWRETLSFIHFRHGSTDGFTPQQLIGPVPWPLSWVVLRPFVVARLAQRLAHNQAVLAETTPTFVVLCAEPDGYLDAGAALTAYWHAAASAGLALHPTSILLQHDDARADLVRTLHLQGDPVFIARVGRPLRPAPPSARRSPLDVLATS